MFPDDTSHRYYPKNSVYNPLDDVIIIIIIIYYYIALISSSVRTCSVRCLEIACVQEHEN